MNQWLQLAKDCGFTAAVPLDVGTLVPMPMVRQACAADKCQAYGKNWTCPPYCGTLEECRQQIQRHSQGLLLQTMGHLEKTIDTKGYRRIEAAHVQALQSFAQVFQKTHPEALFLGAGGCRRCKTCAYPQPCRFPEEAMSSMEGYGLFVTQVCRDNGLPYSYGPKTIAYCACVLYG